MMELMQVIRVLLRRWWLVLLPVIVAALIVIPDLLSRPEAASAGFSSTIRYSAAQVLSAIPGRDGDYQDVWLASELTVNALTDWVRTSSFVTEIVRETAAQAVEINPGALTIAGDNRRSVGQIVLSYPDATQLDAIIQAAVVVLQTRAQHYFPQLGDQPATVTVLDTPQIVPTAAPLTNRFAPLIRLGIALLAGAALAFLAEYLDDRVRRREQVDALGLPVIAIIPRR